MIRAVIADDERDVIDGMRAAIAWAELGIAIVAVASDGVAARAIIEEQQPDILLTDIRMPGLDGLALIRAARERAPDLLSIVFTGHTEYEYAKAAVSLGVVEFLEKPVSVEELEGALRKVTTTLRERQESRAALASAGEARSIVQLEQLHRLVLGLADGETPREGPFSDLESAVIAVTATPGSATDPDSRSRAVGVIRDAFAQDPVSVLILGNEVPLSDSREIAIAVFSKHEELSRSWCEAAFRRVLVRLESLWPTPMIGVGRTVTRAEGLGASFDDARRACRYATFGDARGPTLIEHIDSGHRVPVLLGSSHDQVILSIRAADREGALGATSRFLEDIRVLDVGPDLLCHECLSLVVHALRTADEAGAGSEIGGREPLPHQQISSLRTYDEIQRWVSTSISGVMDRIEAARSGRHRTVNQVIDYLNSQYSSDISLQELSDLVGMNQNYLSALFHRETGLTYLQYLTQIRLERAKHLMDQGMKVGEACRAVGYFDGRHFSTLFQKRFGIKPGEYLRRASRRAGQ